MGILDNLFGGGDDAQQPKRNAQNQNQTADEQAIERYRYMLKTAPPETIEQAHAEAFAKLTPEQRRQVLQQLQENAPEAERSRLAQNGDDPQALARAATRAEVRQPGTIERMFGGAGAGGIGFGGMLAGGFLSSLAGTVIGSYIAQQFFSNDTNFFDNQESNFADANQNEDAGTDNIADASGDVGDFGGDLGDLGGDF